MSDIVPDPRAAARPWYPAPEIETAITRGLLWPGAARRALLSEAAVAAAAELTDLRVGPFPVEFLAYCVRSMGLDRAQNLAEPLPGEPAGRLARTWLAAAAASGTGLAGTDLFTLWLCRVAKLLAARRSISPDAARDPGSAAS